MSAKKCQGLTHHLGRLAVCDQDADGKFRAVQGDFVRNDAGTVLRPNDPWVKSELQRLGIRQALRRIPNLFGTHRAAMEDYFRRAEGANFPMTQVFLDRIYDAASLAQTHTGETPVFDLQRAFDLALESAASAADRVANSHQALSLKDFEKVAFGTELSFVEIYLWKFRTERTSPDDAASPARRLVEAVKPHYVKTAERHLRNAERKAAPGPDQGKLSDVIFHLAQATAFLDRVGEEPDGERIRKVLCQIK
jgi:hypothetical protein